MEASVLAGQITTTSSRFSSDFDYLVAPSNFVREIAQQEWRVPPARLFVITNGYQTISQERAWLEAALGVLRLLRSEDPRFELHVYGGNALWGGEEQVMAPESGVFDHGLTGHRKLARELLKSNFAINLQATPEGFPLAATEAMAYGNIVLASPVGLNARPA